MGGLRVVGAGLPRTGTMSLQQALERLLGGRCYHMTEVGKRLEHVPVWYGALMGETPDWADFLAGYTAAVDWPASAFWKELSEANPDAIVLLSTRDCAETWWESADATVLDLARRDDLPEQYAGWEVMHHALLDRDLTDEWNDRSSVLLSYERHNEAVRSTIPPDRLVEWRPGDRWAPICAALGVPIPDEPFPHVNARADWAALLASFGV